MMKPLKSIQTFPKHNHERGRIKLLKGDKDGSVEDMKKAIELAPENEINISGQITIIMKHD